MDLAKNHLFEIRQEAKIIIRTQPLAIRFKLLFEVEQAQASTVRYQPLNQDINL